MRKILMVLVACATLSTAAFAQASEYKDGVLALTGYEWVNTPEDSKEAFAVGVLFGLDTMRQLLAAVGSMEELAQTMIETYGDAAVPAASDLITNLYNWASWDISTNDIVSVLDNVYMNVRNRKFSIFEVLLTELGKEWWGM